MMDRRDKPDVSEELKRSKAELNALMRIEASAIMAQNADEVIEDVLMSLMDFLKSDAAVLLLREGNRLRPFMSMGVEGGIMEAFTDFVGQGFAGTIAETENPSYVKDTQEASEVINPYIRDCGIRSMMGVPMLLEGDLIGVLHIDWRNVHDFDEREMTILQSGAERCAYAVVNAQLSERLDNMCQQAAMYLDIIEHDIDNLNKAMLGDLKLLLSNRGLSKDDRDSIKGIMDNVNESGTIVSNVRKLHSILSEELPLETMDLDEMITASIKKVGWPEMKNVVIHYEPQQGRDVNGTSMLKDIFYSIIDHAIKRSGNNVELNINVDKVHLDDQPYYSVSIADNVAGIPDMDKPNVFAFHRGMTQAYGKALPMFIVKKLLERMNGAINVTDRVAGDHTKGTKYVITVPAIEGRVMRIEEPAGGRRARTA